MVDIDNIGCRGRRSRHLPKHGSCSTDLMRHLQAILFLFVFLGTNGFEAMSAQEILSVNFVGTGGPEITLGREGIATVVRTSEKIYLFDVGRNAMQNIFEAGIDPREIDVIFLTHLHNDHIEGLPTLWMTGWFLLGRERPLEVYGPPGTQAMIDGMYAMYQFDVEHRANAFNDPTHLKVQVTEWSEDEVRSDYGAVQVTAFRVEHEDGDPAYGYLIADPTRSVLLSGDTRLCPSLIKYGKGVDVIVSNILAMPEALAQKPEMQGVVAKLMTIPEAVELFQATQPRLAVYTHFVVNDIPQGTADHYITETTRELGYLNELFLAKDGWSVAFPDLHSISPPPAAPLKDLNSKKSYQN